MEDIIMLFSGAIVLGAIFLIGVSLIMVLNKIDTLREKMSERAEELLKKDEEKVDGWDIPLTAKMELKQVLKKMHHRYEVEADKKTIIPLEEATFGDLLNESQRKGLILLLEENMSSDEILGYNVKDWTKIPEIHHYFDYLEGMTSAYEADINEHMKLALIKDELSKLNGFLPLVERSLEAKS